MPYAQRTGLLGMQKCFAENFKDCLFSETTNIAQITLHPTTYLMIPLESQYQNCHTSREWYEEHIHKKLQRKNSAF